MMSVEKMRAFPDKALVSDARRHRQQHCATRLKAPSRLADRCVPACLLVGTSTGSWTKRELPLASSLCQPSPRSSPRRGIRVSCRFPPSFLPFLPPAPLLAPSCSRPVLLTRGRRAWRTLDTCEFATSPISINKPRRFAIYRIIWRVSQILTDTFHSLSWQK